MLLFGRCCSACRWGEGGREWVTKAGFSGHLSKAGAQWSGVRRRGSQVFFLSRDSGIEPGHRLDPPVHGSHCLGCCVVIQCSQSGPRPMHPTTTSRGTTTSQVLVYCSWSPCNTVRMRWRLELQHQPRRLELALGPAAPTRQPANSISTAGLCRTRQAVGQTQFIQISLCCPAPNAAAMSEDRTKISLRKGGKRKSRAALNTKQISAPIRQDVGGLPPGAPPMPGQPDPRRKAAPPGGGKVSCPG